MAMAALLLLATVVMADVTVGGYTQFRLNLSDQDSGSFDIARLRVSLMGDLSNDTMYKFQADFAGTLDGGNVSLKDAWIKHSLGEEWMVRGGFASIPFGIEVPQSSADRLPFERSEAAEMFFPGARDLGIYLTFNPHTQGLPPEIMLGYSNGVQRWADEVSDWSRYEQTGANAFLIGLNWPLANDGCIGATYYAGRRDLEKSHGGYSASISDYGTKTLDSNTLGAHLRFNTDSGIGFQAEYFSGKILDLGGYYVLGVEPEGRCIRAIDATGWYAQLDYTPFSAKWVPFYRYDTFSNGDDFRRHTLGVAYNFDEANRASFQWESISSWDGDGMLGLQWQIQY